MGNYLLCITMFIPLKGKSDSLVPKISDDVTCVCCATEQHDIHFGLNSILFMKSDMLKQHMYNYNVSIRKQAKCLHQSSPEKMKSKVNTPHIQVHGKPLSQPQNGPYQQPHTLT